MTPERLEEILVAWREASVLVLGDFMVDEYLIGRADRISPEAPVQVLDVQKETRVPGGAGNVVRNLAVHTGKITVAGVTGNDEPGDYLRETFAALGADVAPLLAMPDRPTTRKTRVLAGRQQILRVDREVRNDLDSSESSRLADAVIQALDGIGAVVLSDYGKGCLTPTLLARVIPECNRRKIPVLVDPKTKDFSRYRGADLVTPNLKETEAAVGFSIESETDVDLAAKKLREECGVKGVLITRSERGMTLYWDTQPRFHVEARAREVFDVTGAGDTVISLLALGLATGTPPGDAAVVANFAAGVVVGKVGTATAAEAEILAAQQSDLAVGGGGKFLSPRAAGLQVQRQKDLGRRVVFTNGIFDLIHVGHIKLLERARALGDLLVVGINSDRSARSLKGPGRPILSEQERGRILAAMQAVDLVVVYDDDTPEKLLELLKPDVLVKGTNYGPDQVVGAAIVEGYGGRVELVPVEDIVSVTAIADRIKSES